MARKNASATSAPAPAATSAPAPAAVVAPAVEAVVEASAAPVVRAPRVTRTHTKESLSTEFDELEAQMENEIEKLRTSSAAGKPSKSQGIKQLRTFLKQVRQIHAHAQRVTRFKKASVPSTAPQNTGLLKPVRVSPEIAQFFSWSQADLRSRVNVTAAVWNYIKTHSLQDTENKKYILINKDAKLAALLRYDPKVHTEPVTYCTLQKFLKVHFVPDPPKVAAPAPAAAAAAPAAESKRRVKA